MTCILLLLLLVGVLLDAEFKPIIGIK